MTADASAGPLAELIRPDGSVVVPPGVASEVLRALVRDTTARVRVDGGEVSGDLRALLYALHAAAEHPHTPATDPGSPTGSVPAAESTVVTVSQAAALLECSSRWVRYLIEAGRLDATRPGAGCWLITTASLQTYRTGNP